MKTVGQLMTYVTEMHYQCIPLDYAISYLFDSINSYLINNYAKINDVN